MDRRRKKGRREPHGAAPPERWRERQDVPLAAPSPVRYRPDLEVQAPVPQLQVPKGPPVCPSTPEFFTHTPSPRGYDGPLLPGMKAQLPPGFEPVHAPGHLPQPGHPQPGHPQPGHPHGHPQPGHPQPGHPQPGPYAAPGHLPQAGAPPGPHPGSYAAPGHLPQAHGPHGPPHPPHPGPYAGHSPPAPQGAPGMYPPAQGPYGDPAHGYPPPGQGQYAAGYQPPYAPGQYDGYPYGQFDTDPTFHTWHAGAPAHGEPGQFVNGEWVPFHQQLEPGEIPQYPPASPHVSSPQHASPHSSSYYASPHASPHRFDEFHTWSHADEYQFAPREEHREDKKPSVFEYVPRKKSALSADAPTFVPGFPRLKADRGPPKEIQKPPPKEEEEWHTESSATDAPELAEPEGELPPNPPDPELQARFAGILQGLTNANVGATADAIVALGVASVPQLTVLAQELYRFACGDADKRPTLTCELLQALLPRVPAFLLREGDPPTTLLVRVVRECKEQALRLAADPERAGHGHCLLIAELFARGLVTLAMVKEAFMQLVFIEAPSDHALHLGCHLLLASGPALDRNEVGSKMVDLVLMRLKELKGGKYLVGARFSLAEVAELRANRWIAKPPKEEPRTVTKKLFQWSVTGGNVSAQAQDVKTDDAHLLDTYDADGVEAADEAWAQLPARDQEPCLQALVETALGKDPQADSALRLVTHLADRGRLPRESLDRALVRASPNDLVEVDQLVLAELTKACSSHSGTPQAEHASAADDAGA